MRSHANVSVSAPSGSAAGGLVGALMTVVQSDATGRVTVGDSAWAGGLIGEAANDNIAQSYATGAVTGGANAEVGGLAGNIGSSVIENAYAIGMVKGGARSKVGGFAGETVSAAIHNTYSIGHVGGKTAAESGGLIGQTDGNDNLVGNYFDIDTSGKSRREGCGNGCDGKVIGKRTQDLQSGLPDGFDPAIWGRKKNINGGYPYLLALPPK